MTNPQRFVLITVLLGGCNGEDPTTGELPCDVAAIVDANCGRCHGEQPAYGAPMPLRTVEDFRAAARDGSPLGEVVMSRARSASAPMPPPPEEPLGEDELATLQAWLDGGMPAREADASCRVNSGGGSSTMLECDADMVVRKGAPYTMGGDVRDETKCFGVELANDGPRRHIIGIGPAVDNRTVVHHFLLFRAPTAQPEAPFDCPLFPPEWEVLYAWAPGAPPHELPSEAGFPMEEGEEVHLVLQMHYNNYTGTTELTDDTAVELCTTTDLRPNDAAVMSFGGTDFTLPPNRSSALTCDFDVLPIADPVMPVRIFQSWPHMHGLGRGMSTTITRPSGAKESLVDVDFSYQSQLLYKTDVAIDVGDRISTTCLWENATPNEVPYGEYSDAEMCFNIVGYYPAIVAPSFFGGLPTAAADCVMK